MKTQDTADHIIKAITKARAIFDAYNEKHLKSLLAIVQHGGRLTDDQLQSVDAYHAKIQRLLERGAI